MTAFYRQTGSRNGKREQSADKDSKIPAAFSDLADIEAGKVGTVIVKDLSRFGRNYIEVGQYIDYVFPAFGIRFIAIQDNVDTEN